MRSTAAAAATAAVSAADVMREVARALHSAAAASASLPHSTPATSSPTSAQVVDNRSSAADTLPRRYDESVVAAAAAAAADTRSSLTAAQRHAERAARLLARTRAARARAHLKDTNHNGVPNSGVTPSPLPPCRAEATGEASAAPSPFLESLPARVVAEFCDLLADDINACDHEGLTPLYRAASQGSAEHVALLLSAPEIDVDAVSGRPMLMLAAAPAHEGAAAAAASPDIEPAVEPATLPDTDAAPAQAATSPAVEATPVHEHEVAAESNNPATVVSSPPSLTTEVALAADADAAGGPAAAHAAAVAAFPEPPMMPVTPTAAAAAPRRWSHSSAMGATAALVAAFRGHYGVLTQLVALGANLTLKNKLGFSVMKLAKMNAKVREAIDAGRVIRERRLLSTGMALLDGVRDLPVDLAALVVACTYR